MSALGAALAAPGSLSSQAPPPADSVHVTPRYPATLNFGTGLINIPTAWVSQESGDIWVNLGARNIRYCQPPCIASTADNWNTNLAIETHWKDRFTVGISIYSQNPEWGFFGQGLVLKEKQGEWYPSVAIGLRNLGPYPHEDRYLVGHDIDIDSTGFTKEVTSGYSHGFSTAPTVYAVATKNFANNMGSVSLGYGSGLFYSDGGLGKTYNDKGTIVRGLFLGARYAIQASDSWLVNFMVDNDGFDWNAGVVGDWRGISIGLYGTELEEGNMNPDKGSLYKVYNYAKLALAIGFNGNVHEIAHGSVLRSQVNELQQEQSQLRAEIQRRNEHIADLESQLSKAQAGELGEVAKRKEQLDSQIQEEREAIKRAEERLEQLQGGQKPPTPPASGTTPPKR
ncbi:MAG TPA: hypothetical protein VEI06_16465 [Gemmatimonadaceae bacterium]|nr:hypothetical protein [Gemmatimonadaceae bacterium]